MTQIPPITSHCALGLVLAISGIPAALQAMRLVLQWVLFDSWSSLEPVMLLPLVVGVLQLATGCTLAWRSRAAWPCLIGYLAASILTVVLMTTIIGDSELGGLTIAGVLLQTVGAPLVVVLAMFIQPAGTSRRDEAGTLALVFGITFVIGIAIRLVDDLSRLTDAHVSSSVGGVAWMIVSSATGIAVAILQIRAGLALRRGSRHAAAALRIFVVASIGVEIALAGVSVVVLSLDNGLPAEIPTGVRASIIAMPILGMIDGIAIPLLLRAYVGRITEEPVAHAVASGPAWKAFLMLPVLGGAAFVAPEVIEHVHGATLAAALTAAITVSAVTAGLAGLASLCGRAAAPIAVIATVAAVVTTLVMVVVQLELSPMQRIETASLVEVTVTCAVLAWLHRTTQPQLPRAVIRS